MAVFRTRSGISNVPYSASILRRNNSRVTLSMIRGSNRTEQVTEHCGKAFKTLSNCSCLSGCCSPARTASDTKRSLIYSMCFLHCRLCTTLLPSWPWVVPFCHRIEVTGVKKSLRVQRLRSSHKEGPAGASPLGTGSCSSSTRRGAAATVKRATTATTTVTRTPKTDEKLKENTESRLHTGECFRLGGCLSNVLGNGA